MKIVFMGTPNFSVPSLKKMIEKFDVRAVVTQPDRASGRGNKITISPIKKVALSYGIPIYQPEKIRKDFEIIDKIRKIEPDFIIVVAYGQILPKEIFDISKYGCINLHASLLPKYRGSSPINWALINGDKKTGDTTIQMDIGIDTGDILLKSEIDITESMSAGELYNILKENGAELLQRTIEGVATGNICGVKQNAKASSHVSLLDKRMAKINWNNSSLSINNLVRGLSSWPYNNIKAWPTAYTNYKGTIVKIYKARAINVNTIKPPGYIMDTSDEGITVATQEGILNIEVLQLPGGKTLEVKEFLKGNRIEKGIVLS